MHQGLSSHCFWGAAAKRTSAGFHAGASGLRDGPRGSVLASHVEDAF